MEGFDYWKLTTVAFSLFAAYFAFQQFRLSRERFKLDLFEKRFAVFAGTRIFLTHILRDGNLETLEPLWENRAAISEASSLFDDQITEFLGEIDRKAIKLKKDHEKDESLPVSDERTLLSQEIHENLDWLTKQLQELKIRFAPYMKFETWT